LKKCIILANGKPPKKNVITFLQKRNYSTLICADGGSNKAKELGLTPDFIIGDLDSITDTTLKFYLDKSKIIKLKSQNNTDVEKCLKFAIQKGFDEAILLGITGNRLDHTFCNLGIVIKFFNKIKLKLIAEESFLIPYSGKVELKTFPGEIISLYGFDKKTKITSKGLKYPLKNTVLPFGERESTSNAAISQNVFLEVNGGIIFVVRNFISAKSNIKL
jgi:thiamine pyrophosphokinase